MEPKIYFLEEEEDRVREELDISNSNFIEIDMLSTLKDADILFVFNKMLLKDFIRDIYYTKHFLLETEDINYIILGDEEMLNLVIDNWDNIITTKIEESFIEGQRGKTLFRFFRIKDKKLYTIVKNFRNFYYVPDENGEYITIDNKRVSKSYDFFAFTPVDYEKDINIMTRYALEQAKKKRIKIGKNYRICNFDIETNASVDSVNTPEAIISIAANDSLTGQNKYWEIRELDETKEKEMIEDFFKFVSKFDIFAGFNISKFDIPYLLNRARKVGVDMSLMTGIAGCYPTTKYRGKDSPFPWFNCIPGINIVDLMDLAAKSIGYLDIKLPDKKLDTLGKYILGERKVETDTPAVLFRNKEFDKLKEYNLQDVNIAVKLDKKLGLIEVLLATIELVNGLNLDAAVWNSKIIDFYLLSTFSDMVMPSINRDREKHIKGAIVTETVPGIHDEVAVMDVAGMYPSIVRTFNISPDTKDENGDIKIGNFKFSSAKKGILVKFIDEFTKLRQHYKQLLKENEKSADYKLLQLKEFTIKKVLASTYGVFGFVGFRFFDNDIANAITMAGRDLLTHMNKVARDNNYIVISSDTDGNCVMHKDGKPDFEALEKTINDSIIDWIKNYTSTEEVIKNHKIYIEYETLFHRVIFSKAKKKYMGLVSMIKGKKLDKLKFYGKGNELIRKDTPAGIKEELRKIVMAVLNNPDKSKNIELIRSKVTDIKKSIKHLPYKDLIIYKEINRDFDDYKVQPIHVRGAIASNKYLGTDFSRQNYKGGYIFVKSNKHPEVDVLFVNDNINLTSDFSVDYDLYLEKYINKKIKLIFGDKVYEEVFRKDRLLSDFLEEEIKSIEENKNTIIKHKDNTHQLNLELQAI